MELLCMRPETGIRHNNYAFRYRPSYKHEAMHTLSPVFFPPPPHKTLFLLLLLLRIFFFLLEHGLTQNNMVTFLRVQF